MTGRYVGAEGGYLISAREGGRKRFVVGLDGDFILYADDPLRAVYVDPEDVPRVVGGVLAMYDPEKVVLERQRLV